MQGQESGELCCEIKLGNKRRFFSPFFFWHDCNLDLLSLSFPARWLNNCTKDCADTEEKVEQQKGATGEGQSTPQHTAGSCCPGVTWSTHSLCSIFTIQLSARSFWASFWDYVLFGDLDPSVLFSRCSHSTESTWKIPPASQSSVGDNYPYTSLCWVRVNIPIDLYCSLLHSSSFLSKTCHCVID